MKLPSDARGGAGECDIKLQCQAELTRSHGYFHGGIIGTIDISSAYMLMFEGSSCDG